MTSPPLCASLHHDALAQSRERWRGLVRLGADFAFETDADGRFSVLAPDPVLGWPAAQLIGTSAASLLAGPASFNPFVASTTLRGRRVWLCRAGGDVACVLLSVAPLAAPPGGVHGIGIDITLQDRNDARLARTLLHHETIAVIGRRMRASARPLASLAAGLAELLRAVDARGATLVLHDPGTPLRVAARAGEDWPGPVQALQDAVQECCAASPVWQRPHTRQLLLCGQSLLLCDGANHFLDRAILAVWREQPWTEDQLALAAALLGLLQPVLEHEHIQRETARQSRTDILTGLLNRQGFTAELARRFERLDREGLPATLMVLGLDGLATLNERAGLQSGDMMLREAATVLRDGVRPTDLAARLGGDLFALWLDGADQFAAAERAERLGRTGIQLPQAEPEGSGPMRMSIGLAVRSSRSFESVESLLYRGWQAMRTVKLEGGGGWRVSAAEPTP